MLERHFNTPDRKSFRTATRLLSGRDSRLDLAGILPAGPVVLVADQRFSASDLTHALRPAVTMIVSGEPSMRHIESLNATCAGLDAAAVVALGGGSTIDTAKAVHCALCFSGDIPRDVERPAPAPLLITVPTTAGSGSETSRFFILSDATGIKCAHRAWSFAPDLAILDPALLEASSSERLVLGAFDTFIHLWETLICRNERAPFVDTLAFEGIGAIASAMMCLATGTPLGDEHFMGLQRASAYGGYAISNTRTGLIHTLGESLAPQTPLSHPETLYVFFSAALTHYAAGVAGDIKRLDRRLAALDGPSCDFEKLVDVWRTLFERLGITKRIADTLARVPVDTERLLTTAARDVVLVKENPALLTPAILRDMVTACLAHPSDARRETA